MVARVRPVAWRVCARVVLDGRPQRERCERPALSFTIHIVQVNNERTLSSWPWPEAHSLRGFPYEAYRQLMAAQHSIDETERMGLDPVEREPENYKPMTGGEWLLVLGGIIVVVGFWTVVGYF